VNRLRPEERARLEAALRGGLSLRAAARAAGVHRATAKAHAAVLAARRCPCGDPAGHRGWCWWRFERSRARKRLLSERFGARWVRQPGAAPRPLARPMKCPHGIARGAEVCALCRRKEPRGERPARPAWMERLRRERGAA
jgi:hypothetical protein